MRVLRFLGVTASPGQMKGDAGPGGAGQIFVADLAQGTQRALTNRGQYQWPIFSLDGKAIHALDNDGGVVTLSVDTGKVLRRQKVAGLKKLVGVDRERPDELLVLRQDPAAPVALLTVATGKVTPLPFDPQDEEQRRILSHLENEERVYGSTRIFVRTESKSAMEGTREWEEIYLQVAGAPPHAISNCAGRNCREPALSADGQRAAYIRVER
jgi:Tol biopolymer transport system component